ncbi:hypothetical protein AK830_g5711 [Neonectria ditissima]|uniref:Rhodopsin domain-containing protein n=1 Tax=Neonectria ditissima TaxID=78410 RepID=A0A0P7BK70_9HYPO|nr:hypothetical protein AK830_g5711 [Neonectria ditissima]
MQFRPTTDRPRMRLFLERPCFLKLESIRVLAQPDATTRYYGRQASIYLGHGIPKYQSLSLGVCAGLCWCERFFSSVQIVNAKIRRLPKMMGGKGPMAVAIMWAFTALTWIFVGLRLYTRAFILQQIGPDDHAYWLSGVLILLYTVFVHIAATHGFGQPIFDLKTEDSARAVYYEMIGQTFAVIGMAVAKTSLGLFLLRIVVQLWHKIVIWIAMVSLMIVSIITAVIFWTQCVPAKKIYDPLRTPEGACTIGVTPFAVLLGVWCAIVDFFFAMFPWIFIWSLNMKYKEKITIAGSMSFGIMQCRRLWHLDTVPLIIWSAAEMAVTLMCVGIPILRPLYRRTVHGSNLSSDRYYRKQAEGSDGQNYNLGDMPPSGGANAGNRGFPNADPKLGIRGPGTITRIAGENPSDESILGPEYRNHSASDQQNGGI